VFTMSNSLDTSSSKAGSQSSCRSSQEPTFNSLQRSHTIRDDMTLELLKSNFNVRAAIGIGSHC
jgi:hypothetical protein